MRPVFRPDAKPLALALVLALGGAAPAYAFQFSFDNGITGSLDTTLSYGVSVRADSRDPQLIGIANGGTARSVNGDNGDLNFDKNKTFANIVRATSELDIKYKNFGFFGRGTAYYDFNLHDSDKLGPTGRDRLGQDVVGLDGFVSATFEPGGKRTNVRIGRQVINWGESTFMLNGINSINPLDVSALRSPGAELKEALLPTAGIWASQELTNAFSVEGFYLTNWDKTRIDPKGSYFSNNDVLSDDADRVILSYGRRRDELFPPTNPVPPGIPVISATAQALYGPYDPAASWWIPRSPDHNPSDHGQYGVAFRYFASNLNDTEFGFYLENYHSRTPILSGTKGTVTSILTGGPLVQPICGVPALIALCHTGTARVFSDYPENIRLFGMSFNTPGPYGIALQGEYAYRPNQPVQLSAPEVILASLGLPNLITGYTQIPGAPAGATAAALVPDGSYIQGYQRVKMSHASVTGTKSWPNVAAADNLIVVGEVGADYFHNLPSDQKFAGPAVDLPATPFGAIVSQAYSVQTQGFTTNFSWGYRLLGRLEYSNLFFNGNVAPRIAFAHDVKGVGPSFNEDTKSVSIGASWEYQRKWVVDAQYTTYFGGRTYCGTDQPPPGGSVTPGQPASWCASANPLKDRDFYSMVVSYSF